MNRRKRRVNPTPPARRNLFVLALFAIGAVALETKLVWLQLVNGEELIAEGQARQVRTVQIPAHRGPMVDRHGEMVAVSTPVESIYVNPSEISGDREAILQLAGALDLDAGELERKITSNKDDEFLWVMRQESPAFAASIMELGITGVDTQREYKRFHPFAEIACHLVGFTDTDDVGIQGLEHNFDVDLAGVPGEKLILKDLRGRQLADIEEIRPARPGAELRLSIDMALQWQTYLEVKRVTAATGASWASAVVTDVHTGEVLALANQPACNPNDSAQRADFDRFRNIAITDTIEPGSTIKPLIIAAALADGLDPNALIQVPREIEVDGKLLIDERADPAGDTLTNIVARSSNVALVEIARSLEAEQIWQTLKDFGLAGPTGSGLGRSEAHGQLNDYALWGSVRRDTIAYGYGLTLTPLQLARAYSAIASGGLLPPMSFVALDEPPERERIISTEIAAELTGMLEAVISGEQATASRAAIPNYTTAGKTGTVRLPVPGGYSETRHRAIFAGFAPATNPRFVMVVVINDPQSNEYYGGQLAAPVFAKVMETALRLYGVPPDNLPEQDPELLTSMLIEDGR